MAHKKRRCDLRVNEHCNNNGISGFSDLVRRQVAVIAIMLPRGDWAFRLAINTALAHVFRSGEILGLYTKYLGGVGLGVSNWAGVVFMFGGLPE